MRFVKGNDLTIVWTINKVVDGVTVPENLSLVTDLKLYVKRGGSVTQISNYQIIGTNNNQIRFVLKGRNQQTGMYALEITYVAAYDARITKPDAFIIVNDTTQLEGVLSSGDLEISTIDFQTALIINGIYYTEEELRTLIQSIIGN